MLASLADAEIQLAAAEFNLSAAELEEQNALAALEEQRARVERLLGEKNDV